MNSTKKIAVILAVCLVLLAMLSACGGDNGAAWEADPLNHWQSSESGEQTNLGAHKLDEENICKVCGAEICIFDAETWVCRYNENGDQTLWLTYNANGELISDLRLEYEYDKDGNILSETQWENGTLLFFTEYLPDSEGYYYPAKETAYNADGTSVYTEYDENFEATKVINYDADGNVIG